MKPKCQVCSAVIPKERVIAAESRGAAAVYCSERCKNTAAQRRRRSQMLDRETNVGRDRGTSGEVTAHTNERRDRLAQYSGERGSMILVTERRHALGPLTCEVCGCRHDGGIARGVVLDEPGVDTPWVLWMLPDGWSLAEHSEIAVCSEHQSDSLLRVMRFADD